MESQLITLFQFGVFLYFVKYFLEISGSPDELHKSETRLVVKFYLNFYVFIYVV